MFDAETLFKEGVRTIREDHNLERGRELLVESLQQNPHNEMAWLWLTRTVETVDKKLQCVNRALKINPANAQALKARDALLAEQAAAKAKAAEKVAQAQLEKELEIKQAKAGAIRAIAEPPHNPSKLQEIAQASEKGDLGEVVGVVWMNIGYQIQKVVYILAIGAPSAFLAYFAFLVPPCTCATAQDDTPVRVVFGGLGLIGMGGALLIAASLLLVFGQHLVVHENGIRRVRWSGRQTWRWNEFTEIAVRERRVHIKVRGGLIGLIVTSLGGYTYYSYEMCFSSADKRQLRLNRDYGHYREVAGRLVGVVGKPIFDRLVAQYNAGEILAFGSKIKLSQDGLELGRKTVALNRIADHYINQGELILSDSTGTGIGSYSIFGAPNAIFLIDLLDRIARQNNKPRSYFGATNY